MGTDNNTPSVPQLHQHLLVSRILTPLHIPTRRPFSPVGTTAPSSSNQTNLHSTVLRNVSHRTKPHPLRPRANKVPTYRHPTTQILCNSSCSCCHERQSAWGSHVKNAGGVAMMYFPVVAIVMFWPYAVPPVMDYVEARLRDVERLLRGAYRASL